MQFLYQAWRFLRMSLGFAMLLLSTKSAFSQAALLLEQPYGVFGTVNPTGHAALYLERVCADTPIHLRSCNEGENGVIISRYKGMAGYDWVAIPLIPYLYSVEDPASVPAEVNQETVRKVRDRYHEAHLMDLGQVLPPGNFFNDGWAQLVGTAYDRRTYAFRFATTPEQDRAVIEMLNSRPNQTRFNLLYRNCADFDRSILSIYFPHKFGRNIFPDAGITTPKHITYELVKYAHKHPETQLTILEIPQVPGFRRTSRNIHGVDESLIYNGYVVPIVLLNPYVAGGLVADYLVQSHHKLVPKNVPSVDPEHMEALTDPASNPATKSVSQPAVGADSGGSAKTIVNPGTMSAANPETPTPH